MFYFSPPEKEAFSKCPKIERRLNICQECRSKWVNMFLIFCLASFRGFLKAGYKRQALLMKECFQTFFEVMVTWKVWKYISMGDDLQLFLAFILSGLFFEWNAHNNRVRKK